LDDEAFQHEIPPGSHGEREEEEKKKKKKKKQKKKQTKQQKDGHLLMLCHIVISQALGRRTTQLPPFPSTSGATGSRTACVGSKKL